MPIQSNNNSISNNKRPIIIIIIIIIKSMMLGYWDDVPYFQDGCGMLGARSHFSPFSAREDNHLKEIKCINFISLVKK